MFWAQVIHDCWRRIQNLQAGNELEEPVSIGDPEALIEELMQLIRKAETEKMKAEAKIEVMKEGGGNNCK